MSIPDDKSASASISSDGTPYAPGTTTVYPPQGVLDALHATAASVDQLATEVEHLASQEYVDELHRKTMAKEKRTRGILVIASLVIVLLLGALITIALQNRANGKILVECTTETTKDDVHECFERGVDVQTQFFVTQARMEKMLELLLKDQDIKVPPTPTPTSSIPKQFVTPTPTSSE